MRIPDLIISLLPMPLTRSEIAARALATTWVNAVFVLMAQAIVIMAAFQDLRGQEVDAVESIAQGLKRWLPVLGVSILVGLAVGFGFVLLIIPGLIAMTRFAVALPACVVEELSPLESMSRSRDLTEGYGGPIFGVLIALEIASLVVVLIIRAALGHGTTVTLAVWGWMVAYRAYSSVFRAILYHDLRAAKEGVDIDQIAAVFD